MDDLSAPKAREGTKNLNELDIPSPEFSYYLKATEMNFIKKHAVTLVLTIALLAVWYLAMIYKSENERKEILLDLLDLRAKKTAIEINRLEILLSSSITEEEKMFYQSQICVLHEDFWNNYKTLVTPFYPATGSMTPNND